MARAKVVHSGDACTIIFKGNRNNAEPSTGVIKFPGGYVEVTRTTNGKYWAHVAVDESANLTQSRIDYDHEGYMQRHNSGEKTIPPIPLEHHIQHIAILVDGPFFEPGE